jgi:hypothetical protein
VYELSSVLVRPFAAAFLPSQLKHYQIVARQLL